MTSVANEIRKRVFRLLKNVLIVCFTLIFFRTIRPHLASSINFEIEGFTITGGTVLDTLSLIFTIYFGYFILIDSKYFLDTVNKFAAIKLGRKERGKVKSVAYDIAAIISLILVAELLTPFVTSIPDVGDAMAKGINIVFLAASFFVVYHLANEIYYLMKKHVEKLIEKTLRRQIKKEHKKETSLGEPE